MDTELQMLPLPKEQIISHCRKILPIATDRFNQFLGIQMKQPSLRIEEEIKIGESNPVAETEIIDGEKWIVLRPLERYKATHQGNFPSHIFVHEIAHLAEEEFIGRGTNSDQQYWTPGFLGDGFAEFLSMDDPAELSKTIGIQKEQDSYTRLKQIISKNSPYGNVIKSHLYLNKLFATAQPDMIQNPDSEEAEAKAMVPYIVGSTLVRYIYERGGLEALRGILSEVTVDSNFSYNNSNPSMDSQRLLEEETRVQKKLRDTLQKHFGDVEAFEQEWRKTVLDDKSG